MKTASWLINQTGHLAEYHWFSLAELRRNAPDFRLPALPQQVVSQVQDDLQQHGQQKAQHDTS